LQPAVPYHSWSEYREKVEFLEKEPETYEEAAKIAKIQIIENFCVTSYTCSNYKIFPLYSFNFEFRNSISYGGEYPEIPATFTPCD
ncbi:unnamed protein product, partial [marine sediment metagenome]